MPNATQPQAQRARIGRYRGIEVYRAFHEMRRELYGDDREVVRLQGFPGQLARDAQGAVAAIILRGENPLGDRLAGVRGH